MVRTWWGCYLLAGLARMRPSDPGHRCQVHGDKPFLERLCLVGVQSQPPLPPAADRWASGGPRETPSGASQTRLVWGLIGAGRCPILPRAVS